MSSLQHNKSTNIELMTILSFPWRNSRGPGGGQGDSLTLLTGKFVLTYWEKRGTEKKENGEEKKEIEKGKVENWKWKGKSYKMRRGLFLFFFCFLFCCFCFCFLGFFLFCFVLFCFFWLFTFQNHCYLFWVFQNLNFLPGKSISRREKKFRKNDFAPSEKYSSYASASFTIWTKPDIITYNLKAWYWKHIHVQWITMYFLSSLSIKTVSSITLWSRHQK